MDKHNALLVACGVSALLALGATPRAVAAEPCEKQISEISRTLANDPSLGSATAGALAGAAPGAITRDTPMLDPAATSVEPSPWSCYGMADGRS